MKAPSHDIVEVAGEILLYFSDVLSQNSELKDPVGDVFWLG